MIYNCLTHLISLNYLLQRYIIIKVQQYLNRIFILSKVVIEYKPV
jgi:hypothetical protein